MKLHSLQVRNYKSFADSGKVGLGSNFNFLIGKNNSGKSALLEGLRARSYTSQPHRSLGVAKNAIVPARSEFVIEGSFSASELLSDFMARGGQLYLGEAANAESEVALVAEDLLVKSGVEFELTCADQAAVELTLPVDAGLGAKLRSRPQTRKLAVVIHADSARGTYQANSSGTIDQHELRHFLFSAFQKRIFYFSAERLRVWRCPTTSSAHLESDASNLAVALHAMQQSRELWSEFNANVNRVLHNVTNVITPLVPGANQIEIKTWPVDPKTRRDDLIVGLEHGGSGVAQVLAILCAVMTNENAIIVIDEPANFLHPGAAKALMQILSEYPHQYVMSTHSLDVVGATDQSKMFAVRWTEGVSSVSEIQAGDLSEQRRVLADLGASLSDVLGVDRLLWVEGETESLSIPIVIQAIRGQMPGNINVIPIKTVGDLLNTKKLTAVWEAYKQTASIGGLIPLRARFLLDRDMRGDEEILALEKSSEGAVKFLPRYCIENYLLDPRLLAAELDDEARKYGVPVVGLYAVEKWFAENGHSYAPEVWTGSISDDWKRKANGARILKDLFWALIKAEFRKTQHSTSLVRRLMQREGGDGDELKEIVAERLELSLQSATS